METVHINDLTEQLSLHSKVVTAVKEPYRGRASGAEWKITSREVEVPKNSFSRSVIKFSDISKPYCLGLNSLNNSFYNYYAAEVLRWRPKERHALLLGLQELRGIGRWTLQKLNLCSYEVTKFADLCNVNEFPFLKMQKPRSTEVTLLKILADDKSRV